MIKASIENMELLKHPSHEKKLRSALNRISKACKEIADMDYSIYVSAHGNINVMNVDDAPYLKNIDYEHHQIVANTSVERMDCGDW